MSLPGTQCCNQLRRSFHVTRAMNLLFMMNQVNQPGDGDTLTPRTQQVCVCVCVHVCVYARVCDHYMCSVWCGICV